MVDVDARTPRQNSKVLHCGAWHFCSFLGELFPEANRISVAPAEAPSAWLYLPLKHSTRRAEGPRTDRGDDAPRACSDEESGKPQQRRNKIRETDGTNAETAETGHQHHRARNHVNASHAMPDHI